LEIVISPRRERERKKIEINQIEKKKEEAGPTELPSQKKRTLMSFKNYKTHKKKKMRKRPYISSALSLFFLLLILLACRTRRLSAITSHNPLAMVWK
jgi:hypothetical protein